MGDETRALPVPQKAAPRAPRKGAPAAGSNRGAEGPTDGAPDAEAGARLAHPALVLPVLVAACAAASYYYAFRNLPNPDEGAGLTAAAKLLRGEVFYKHIDAYPFPGATYLLAGLMSVFGEHLTVARLAAGASYTGMVVALYLAALQLLERRRAALFAFSLLSLKFLAYPNFTSYLYSDIALAATAVAGACFLRHAYRGFSPWVLLAGFFVGLSVVSKQNLGLYVAGVMGLVLLFPAVTGGPPRARPEDRWTEVAVFGLGVLIPTGALSAYFASQGLFLRMVESGLLRPFTGYLPTSGVAFAPMLRWWEFGALDGVTSQIYFPLHVREMLELGWIAPGLHGAIAELFSRALYSALPVVGILCALLWLWALRSRLGGMRESERTLERRRRFFVWSWIAGAAVLSAFPRTDYSHIIGIYPVFFLSVFALGQIGDLGFRWRASGPPPPPRMRLGAGRRQLRVEAVAVIALLVWSAGLAWHFNSRLTHRMTLERADVWLNPRDAWVESLIRYMHDEVPPGQALFIYGHEAHYYFLTDRYFPWRFTQLYPGMAGADDGKTLADLIYRVRPPIILRGLPQWPGVPDFTEYTSLTSETISRFYATEHRLFELYPPRGEPPPEWLFLLKRMRGLPPAAGPKR